MGPRLFRRGNNEAKREGYTVIVRESRELCTQDDVGLQQIDKTRKGRLVYKKKWGHPTSHRSAPEGFPADPSPEQLSSTTAARITANLNIGKNGEDVKGNKNKSILTGFL